MFSVHSNANRHTVDSAVKGIFGLRKFYLQDDGHRAAFLFEYYWHGEEALFEAVAHVWNSLAEPRKARCTGIGRISGTGGTGKTGLLLTLQKFLAECLAQIEPIPDRANYAGLDEWHEASMQSFANDEQRVRQVCSRYAAILDGSLPTPLVREPQS